MANSSQGGRGFTHLVKLLLIGDTAVGKSSVLLRFADDQFSGSFITTIGIDFKIKSIQLGDKKVKLQIWDTAGQERFMTITAAYYRGAMGIILVFDVSNRKSFQNVKSWMNQIDMHAAENVNKLLIGNKCDLPHDERCVTTQEAEALAAQYKVTYFETSAKMNVGVTEAITHITTSVLARLHEDQGVAGGEGGVNVDRSTVGAAQPKTAGGGCC